MGKITMNIYVADIGHIKHESGFRYKRLHNGMEIGPEALYPQNDIKTIKFINKFKHQECKIIVIQFKLKRCLLILSNGKYGYFISNLHPNGTIVTFTLPFTFDNEYTLLRQVVQCLLGTTQPRLKTIYSCFLKALLMEHQYDGICERPFNLDIEGTKGTLTYNANGSATIQIKDKKKHIGADRHPALAFTRLKTGYKNESHRNATSFVSSHSRP